MAESKKAMISKQFTQPDERRPFKGHGHLDVLSFGEAKVIGHGVFEPGWKWSNDLKPIAGTDSCQSEHLGYCLAGEMVIRMNNGEEIRVKAGDAFHIEPGHDAWVIGNQSCEMLDFIGFKDYAKPKGEQKKVA